MHTVAQEQKLDFRDIMKTESKTKMGTLESARMVLRPHLQTKSSKRSLQPKQKDHSICKDQERKRKKFLAEFIGIKKREFVCSCVNLGDLCICRNQKQQIPTPIYADKHLFTCNQNDKNQVTCGKQDKHDITCSHSKYEDRNIETCNRSDHQDNHQITCSNNDLDDRNREIYSQHGYEDGHRMTCSQSGYKDKHQITCSKNTNQNPFTLPTEQDELLPRGSQERLYIRQNYVPFRVQGMLGEIFGQLPYPRKSSSIRNHFNQDTQPKALQRQDSGSFNCLLASNGDQSPQKACNLCNHENCYCAVGSKTSCCYQLLRTSKRIRPTVIQYERPEQMPIFVDKYIETVQPEPVQMSRPSLKLKKRTKNIACSTENQAVDFGTQVSIISSEAAESSKIDKPNSRQNVVQLEVVMMRKQSCDATVQTKIKKKIAVHVQTLRLKEANSQTTTQKKDQEVNAVVITKSNKDQRNKIEQKSIGCGESVSEDTILDSTNQIQKPYEPRFEKQEADIISSIDMPSLEKFYLNEKELTTAHVQTDFEQTDSFQESDVYNKRLIIEVERLSKVCNYMLSELQQQPDKIAELAENTSFISKCNQVLDILVVELTEERSGLSDDVEDQVVKLQEVRAVLGDISNDPVVNSVYESDEKIYERTKNIDNLLKITQNSIFALICIIKNYRNRKRDQKLENVMEIQIAKMQEEVLVEEIEQILQVQQPEELIIHEFQMTEEVGEVFQLPKGDEKDIFRERTYVTKVMATSLTKKEKFYVEPNAEPEEELLYSEQMPQLFKDEKEPITLYLREPLPEQQESLIEIEYMPEIFEVSSGIQLQKLIEPTPGPQESIFQEELTPKQPDYDKIPPTDISTSGNITTDSEGSLETPQQNNINNKVTLNDYTLEERFRMPGIIVSYDESPSAQMHSPSARSGGKVVQLRNLNLQPGMRPREREAAEACYKLPVQAHSPFKQKDEGRSTPYNLNLLYTGTRRAESTPVSYGPKFNRGEYNQMENQQLRATPSSSQRGGKHNFRSPTRSPMVQLNQEISSFQSSIKKDGVVEEEDQETSSQNSIVIPAEAQTFVASHPLFTHLDNNSLQINFEPSIITLTKLNQGSSQVSAPMRAIINASNKRQSAQSYGNSKQYHSPSQRSFLMPRSISRQEKKRWQLTRREMDKNSEISRSQQSAINYTQKKKEDLKGIETIVESQKKQQLQIFDAKRKTATFNILAKTQDRDESNSNSLCLQDLGTDEALKSVEFLVRSQNIDEELLQANTDLNDSARSPSVDEIRLEQSNEFENTHKFENYLLEAKERSSMPELVQDLTPNLMKTKNQQQSLNVKNMRASPQSLAQSFQVKQKNLFSSFLAQAQNRKGYNRDEEINISTNSLIRSKDLNRSLSRGKPEIAFQPIFRMTKATPIKYVQDKNVKVNPDTQRYIQTNVHTKESEEQKRYSLRQILSLKSNEDSARRSTRN